MLKTYAFLPPTGRVDGDVDSAICFNLVGCRTRHKVIVAGGNVSSFEASGIVTDMNIRARIDDPTVEDLVVDGFIDRIA